MKYTILLLLFVAACAQPPEDVDTATIEEAAPVQELQSESKMITEGTFQFEGYGPGKSHLGTFDTWSGEVKYEDGEVVQVIWEIDASSVNTGIGALDNHLQSDDFFDVENYPKITFVSSSIGNGKAVGNLEMHGVTKEVSFDFEVVDGQAKADFLIDTTPFGMKMPGADKEVRIMFDLKV